MASCFRVDHCLIKQAAQDAVTKDTPRQCCQQTTPLPDFNFHSRPYYAQIQNVSFSEIVLLTIPIPLHTPTKNKILQICFLKHSEIWLPWAGPPVLYLMLFLRFNTVISIFLHLRLVLKSDDSSVNFCVLD